MKSNPFEKLNSEKFNDLYNQLSNELQANAIKLLSFEGQNLFLNQTIQYYKDRYAEIYYNSINASILGNTKDSIIYDKSNLIKFEDYELYISKYATFITNKFASSSVFDTTIIEGLINNIEDNQKLIISEYDQTIKVALIVPEAKDLSYTLTIKLNHFQCNACLYNISPWVKFNTMINSIVYHNNYITFPEQNVNIVSITVEYKKENFIIRSDGMYEIILLIDNFQLFNITTPDNLIIFGKIAKRGLNAYIESITINGACRVSNNINLIHNITNDETKLLLEEFDSIIYIPNKFDIENRLEFYYRLIMSKIDLTEPLLFQDAVFQFQI